jgi:acetone carboxylase gamma subunit
MEDKRLSGEDERVQKVMALLQGSFNVNDVNVLINELFQCNDNESEKRVAQCIVDMHCCDEGYSNDDIAKQLTLLC